MVEDNHVYIVGIAASSRVKGNTEILLDRALEGAREAMNHNNNIIVEVNKLVLGGKRIFFCDACDTCHRDNRCHFRDFITEKVIPELIKADGIILASPIYMHNISGLAKVLMDRTNCLFTEDGYSLLRNKVGGAIVVGQERQGGKAFGLMTIIAFFLMHGMIVVGGTSPEGYPGVSGWTFGTTEKDAVLKDKDALDAAYELGLRVAVTAYNIKNGVRLP